ncbi:MAG: histidine kinase [Desulfobacteraceae bacterium]|nr:MAG: histidine kinase [Desulfobacteraceae bacterium]
MEEEEYIPAEQFDREYGLSDLLPESMIAGLMEEIAAWLPVCILSPAGEVHYAGGAVLPESVDEAMQMLRKEPRNFIMVNAGEANAFFFPLLHELDQIGYLCFQPPRHCDAHCLLPMGRFMANALNRIIFITYQNKMTAGLHVQVVTESYNQLKDRAARLQVSEEKYRRLAENLEQEVERKTRDIQEAQLRMLQQEKLASIGQLAAGMAHEINNPIGFVISNLNTLKHSSSALADLIRQYQGLLGLLGDPADPKHSAVLLRQGMAAIDQVRTTMDIDFVLEDTGQLIDESLEGARRIQAIVQNLRDFSHPGVEAKECVDINACLDNALAVLKSQIKPGVRIIKDYCPLPAVVGRPRELSQVFFQILLNALQAVGEKGDIGIMTRAVQEMIDIRISDSGPGIRPDHRARLFEPFFTTREVGQGTGLGLNLAYNIVQTHHGRISVESTVGRGTVMIVSLPVQNA